MPSKNAKKPMTEVLETDLHEVLRRGPSALAASMDAANAHARMCRARELEALTAAAHYFHTLAKDAYSLADLTEAQTTSKRFEALRDRCTKSAELVLGAITG